MLDINFKNFNPRNFKLFLLKFSIIKRNFLNEEKNFLIKKIGIIFFILLLFYFVFLASPLKFPVGSIVKIDEGLSTQEITNILKDKKVIKSEFLFKITVRIFRGDKGVRSGDYFFEKRKNLFSVTYRMIRGIFGITPIKMTLHEGLTIKEMSDILAKKIPDFDSKLFITEAREKEGYLFPDTYYFLPNIKVQNIIKVMENNFYKKIDELKDEIEKSGYSLNEIITMASILEEEGVTFQDRKMMSGVLWNRINIDMPLQVDAVFPYIIGKNTYEISLDDLKNDSLYNTYLYKGLPPGPITNPGFNSIVAALEPIQHNYLYYLSDRQQNTYYAETFEGHKKNRLLYLNK